MNRIKKEWILGFLSKKCKFNDKNCNEDEKDIYVT